MVEVSVSGISRRRFAARSDGGADYRAKRAELIRIAANVFSERGYAAATLNDVAARFGTDRASLYYYVESKEELFQECINDIVVSNIEKAEEIFARNLGPKEKLRRLIGLVIRSQVDHYPHMYVYIQEDMRKVVSEDALWAQDMVEKTRQIERYFMSAFQEGVADGSFRAGMSTTLVANAIFGMMMWTHRWFIPGRAYGAENLIETFTTILFQGIEASAADSQRTEEA